MISLNPIHIRRFIYILKMYTTIISVSEESLTTQIMKIQRTYLKCGILIQSDSKFSRHAIFDCSWGQYNILQYEHRSNVNIFRERVSRLSTRIFWVSNLDFNKNRLATSRRKENPPITRIFYKFRLTFQLHSVTDFKIITTTVYVPLTTYEYIHACVPHLFYCNKMNVIQN